MISFITATLNSAETLALSLSSVVRAAQRINGEVIVVDGGSSDQTGAVVSSFMATGVVRLLPQQSRGLYPALMEGVFASSFPNVMFVHSDDVLVGFDVLAVPRTPNEVVVGSVDIIGVNGRVAYRRYPPLFRRRWLWHFAFIMHPNAVYPRALLIKYPFDSGRYGRKADMYQIAVMSSEVSFRRARELVYGFRVNPKSTTVQAVNADTGCEGFLFWVFRIYSFVLYEDRRLLRVWNALFGLRAWSVKNIAR